MAAAAWADAKNATVAYLDLDSLSPGAIYALASGRYTEQTVERVLDAAAAAQRHINDSDVKEIAKAGAKAAILQGIEADQKAEAEAGSHCLLPLGGRTTPSNQVRLASPTGDDIRLQIVFGAS